MISSVNRAGRSGFGRSAGRSRRVDPQTSALAQYQEPLVASSSGEQSRDLESGRNHNSSGTSGSAADNTNETSALDTTSQSYMSEYTVNTTINATGGPASLL